MRGLDENVDSCRASAVLQKRAAIAVSACIGNEQQT